MQIKFKKCSFDEIPLVSDLASEIWNEYYPSIIGQQQVNYMLDKMYNAAAMKDQIHSGQVFFLVFVNAQAIGFFSYSIKEDNSGFLHKFYILKDYRGKGVAREILNFLELQFKKQ
ncbi:MAG: GNAT family N-acetyltransferase, partial [Bacteroidia bacterium]